MRSRLLVLGLLLGLGLAAAARSEVRIVSPGGGEAVFGEVRFAVEVTGEGVAEVELRVDGRTVARLTRSPFEAVVDVGQENTEHRFEAFVQRESGGVDRLRLTTPAIHVDEVMDLELQQVYVTVTDSSKRRRLDLGIANFELKDDGLRQELVTVGSGTIPFTAVILLDGSLSMEGPQAMAARAGLMAFARGMRENDEAQVLVFGDRLLAASPFTSDPEELVTPLERTLPPGGTAVFDHLYMALRLLEPRLGRRVVILISDGGDVHSVLRMKDVRETARRSQAMIYWLETPRPGAGSGPYLQSFLPPEEVEAEHRRLVKSVRETGGRVLRVESPAQIRLVLQEVLRELREQYALGYYPEPRGDGRWRELQIKVRERGLRVRAPEGYFSPVSESP